MPPFWTYLVFPAVNLKKEERKVRAR